MPQNSRVFFTVVIPTRNRVELFKLAIDSVIAQSFKNFEIIVVNDGSSDECLAGYKALEAEYSNHNVKFRYQIRRPNGHGQSYSMNTGAYVGEGQYLCFLDDDDFWIDNDHLQNAYNSITRSEMVVDAYYTNQIAYFSDGAKQNDNVWIEDLATKVASSSADAYGASVVTQAFLLSSGGFAHLNCSIVRRELYLDIKGMDENIRYECDRDIYIRTIDAAQHILYCPNVISQHHIPDPKKADNMSTMINLFEKSLYQINVYEKGSLMAQRPEIREFCNKSMTYIYKKITMQLVESKDWPRAHTYAVKALACSFSFKWWLYSRYLLVKKGL